MTQEINLPPDAPTIDQPKGGKKNIVLDASMLSELMSCARKLDLRYNHRFVSANGKSNSLEVGSLIHVVLETYYKSIIQGFKKDLAASNGLAMGEEYIRGCKACLQQLTTGTPCAILGHAADPWLGLKNTPVDSDSRYVGWKNAMEDAELYFAHYRNDYWVPLEVEVVKARILYEDDEIRILWKAKLDVVFDTNQGIYPTDHKTSKQRRDILSLNNQFMGQCHIMDTRGVMINKFGFQKTLKPEEKFTRVQVSYSADRLIEWQSEILPHYAYQLLNYTEAEHFPPNFTHCESKYGNCIYVPVCSSDRGMREEEIRLHFVKGPEWNPSNAGEE
jgi:hypothetical protein